MARAEVDLDDPVKGGDGAALNSADDLLAQLAGDEVDRMLSEADAAAPEPLNVDRAVPEPVSVLEATEAALDGLFNELNAAAPQGVPPAPVAAIGPPVEQEPAAEPGALAKEAPIDTQSIEEVITRRAQDLIAQARREDDAVAVASDSPLSTGEPLSAADALAAEMDADERAHLEALKRMKSGGSPDDPNEAPAATSISTPAPSDTAPTQIDEDKIDYSKPDKSDRVPILVRVLEWINAPLAGLSDGVRAGIGKVAIVTTLNAVAVFAYVMLFRRH